MLVEDDPTQTAVARSLLASGFAVTATVLLETEWVLRSVYRWPRKAIAAAMAELMDLPTLAEAPTAIRWALDRYAAGSDFADMVHLAVVPLGSQFATFDRRIAKAAGGQSPAQVMVLT